MIRIALLALLFAAGIAQAAEPQDDAASFYREYQKMRKAGMTGIPNERRLQQLSAFITPELKSLFAAALKEQKRCAQKFPGDKPPWIEGDIFSSNFEGFTAFNAMHGGARNEIAIDFTYAEGKSEVKWRDVLVLKQSGKKWLVDDLNYRGQFAFGSGFGKNLRGSLQALPACGQ